MPRKFSFNRPLNIKIQRLILRQELSDLKRQDNKLEASVSLRCECLRFIIADVELLQWTLGLFRDRAEVYLREASQRFRARLRRLSEIYGVPQDQTPDSEQVNVVHNLSSVVLNDDERRV